MENTQTILIVAIVTVNDSERSFFCNYMYFYWCSTLVFTAVPGSE